MGAASEGVPPEDSPDLRVPLLAVVSWAGALVGFLVPGWVSGMLMVAGVLVLLLRHRGGRPVTVLAGCLLAATAVASVAMLHEASNRNSAVASLASERAYVSVVAQVTSDPRLRQGQFEPFVLLRTSVRQVTARGRLIETHVPVLVIGDVQLQETELGSRIRLSGRLSPSDGDDLAAVLSTTRAPVVVTPPGDLLGAAAAVRSALRASVAPLEERQRSLIPALVVGDDQQMPDELVQDFQVSGLTHLSAVSGTNLTLVVGFVLIIARWAGVRARGLIVVGALGVIGFVLLARTEPSVVRAAAMGSVALIGMGSNGRQRGTRALGVAVLVLLLFDPWLAMSLGFALSSLATAGILFLAPPWRDALMTWTPRWVAEAVAVPLAAQLVCTPVIAAISGQVSMVAVVANMLVAAAVGPATVAGLVGGLLMLVAPPLGLLCGRVAGGCAWWIVTVATHSAKLPSAAVDWSAGLLSVSLLALVCLLLAFMIPRVLLRRGWMLAGVVLMFVVLVRPVPTPGWPPRGWVMVACDVGQGDAMVLNAGNGDVVVVDVGPDPEALSRCLDRLDAEEVPVVVLTHFHADHIDGLAGVLSAAGSVQKIAVTGTRDPEAGAVEVDAQATAMRTAVTVPDYGAVSRVGDVTWQVIGPAGQVDGPGHGEEGSAANNASLVLLVVVHGIRILLTGDIEPEAQRQLMRTVPGLAVDVLKVPHHGSRYQEPAFVTGLGARVALVSVGKDNDYGHPASATLALLEQAGMAVRRTDDAGDVAVVVQDGRLSVVTAR